jgi:hypothetical protein
MVRELVLLDISPTRTMYERTNMDFARMYYHWFFLIQPEPLPEKLIGAGTSFYLWTKLDGYGTSTHGRWPSERCFALSGTVHAMCEDYRASASIDLEHDRAMRTRKSRVPYTCCGANAVSCIAYLRRSPIGRKNASYPSPAGRCHAGTTLPRSCLRPSSPNCARF